MFVKKIGAFVVATTVAVSSFGEAKATTVDLELYLLNDSSGSIIASDFNTYINGYVAAFRNSALVTAIQDGVIGKIAVGFGFFSDSFSAALDFTVIEDLATANAFADAIAALSRPFSDGTNPTAGLNGAVSLFGSNGFDGTRQVIDITLDGSQGTAGCSFSALNCLPLQNARDAAEAAGIDAINALLIQDRNFFGNDVGNTINAEQYAATNLLLDDSFSVFIEGFQDFGPAIQDKLIAEIRDDDMPPVPLPAAGWMLIAGIGGLAAMRRRKDKAAA